MSVWKIVRLKFSSVVHFGEVGIGLEETSERVRSDTLFSAWISAYARLFGNEAVEELLQHFCNDPPVRMSSTFIYRHHQKRDIYYLPRPLSFPINYPQGKDLEFFKTYKKLNYLPLEVWQRWYQGEGFTKRDRKELLALTKDKNNKDNSEGSLYRAGTFDYKDACKTAQLPKIAVDRVTRATNLYQTGFVQFKEEVNKGEIKSWAGLYFLVNFCQKDAVLENQLLAALKFLGEEGLGGERSSGAGRFTVDAWLSIEDNKNQSTKTWEDVINFKQGKQHNLISLFWTDESSKINELLDNSSYEIIERGGWISSSPYGHQKRRKMVRMFAEGSVFPIPPQGKLADVTPPGFKELHSIYRSGISLSLPIKVTEEK